MIQETHFEIYSNIWENPFLQFGIGYPQFVRKVPLAAKNLHAQIPLVMTHFSPRRALFANPYDSKIIVEGVTLTKKEGNFLYPDIESIKLMLHNTALGETYKYIEVLLIKLNDELLKY